MFLFKTALGDECTFDACEHGASQIHQPSWVPPGETLCVISSQSVTVKSILVRKEAFVSVASLQCNSGRQGEKMSLGTEFKIPRAVNARSSCTCS